MPIERALWGHTDEVTALVVDDYPYGRRVRTQIRYWIETTKNGDRFVSQTLNPQTGRWNKPKKSTYCEVGVMIVKNEEGHIGWTGLTMHASPEHVERFKDEVENLSVAQKAKLARVIGVNKAFENVTFKVEQVTAPPTAEEEAEQAAIREQIARNANAATREAFRGLS